MLYKGLLKGSWSCSNNYNDLETEDLHLHLILTPSRRFPVCNDVVFWLLLFLSIFI